MVELAQELPGLKTFATLSPIPGFRAWLASLDATADDSLSADEAKAIERLSPADWHGDEEAALDMQEPLTRLCARYLLRVKARGRPLDPVARFHLRNGARLERLNWLGNVSRERAGGFRRSARQLRVRPPDDRAQSRELR